MSVRIAPRQRDNKRDNCEQKVRDLIEDSLFTNPALVDEDGYLKHFAIRDLEELDPRTNLITMELVFNEGDRFLVTITRPATVAQYLEEMRRG